MPTSVMPKGVEHTNPVAVTDAATHDAHLCDAEKR